MPNSLYNDNVVFFSVAFSNSLGSSIANKSLPFTLNNKNATSSTFFSYKYLS